MKNLLPLIALATLTGCDNAPIALGGAGDTGSSLDDQAIAAGILPDPDNVEFAGRFETRGDLGTDKFCAVREGGERFQIGVLAVFGPESKCEGKGWAKISDEKVQVTLEGKDACRFTAQYDGVELRFPGTIESGCSSYCSSRASLSGTHYFMIQPGDDSARKSLGRDIDRLCD